MCACRTAHGADSHVSMELRCSLIQEGMEKQAQQAWRGNFPSITSTASESLLSLLREETHRVTMRRGRGLFMVFKDQMAAGDQAVSPYSWTTGSTCALKGSEGEELSPWWG